VDLPYCLLYTVRHAVHSFNNLDQTNHHFTANAVNRSIGYMCFALRKLVSKPLFSSSSKYTIQLESRKSLECTVACNKRKIKDSCSWYSRPKAKWTVNTWSRVVAYSQFASTIRSKADLIECGLNWLVTPRCALLCVVYEVRRACIKNLPRRRLPTHTPALHCTETVATVRAVWPTQTQATTSADRDQTTQWSPDKPLSL